MVVVRCPGLLRVQVAQFSDGLCAVGELAISAIV